MKMGDGFGVTMGLRYDPAVQAGLRVAGMKRVGPGIRGVCVGMVEGLWSLVSLCWVRGRGQCQRRQQRRAWAWGGMWRGSERNAARVGQCVSEQA
jgi:hypothetical protein